MTAECTTEDCRNWTELYLCGRCVADLQAWLDKVPEAIGDLYITMAKLDKTAPQRSEGGGGLSTGAALPIRLGAMELRSALMLWANADAARLANDKFAGGFQPMLEDLLRKATSMIDNPPEVRVIATCDCGGNVTTKGPKPEPTADNPDPIETGKCEECGTPYEKSEAATKQRIIDATPAGLKTRDALKWIRENSGLSIKPTDIRNWARERKLTPTNPDRGAKDLPTYNVSDILKIHYRHVETKKRVTSF